MSYVCFSLFWPKKVNFKAKIDSFLTITLKKTRFDADTSMYRNSNFVCICFAHESMNK